MNLSEKHARYYLSLMERAPNDWRQIEPELDQIRRAWLWVCVQPDTRMALDFINAIHFFQNNRGYWHEQIAWCTDYLEKLETQTKENISVLQNIAWCHYALGEFAEATKYLAHILELLRNDVESPEYASALSALGTVYNEVGDFKKGIPHLEKALIIRRSLGDRAGEAATLGNLALAKSHLGDRSAAIALLIKASEIHKEQGDQHLLAVTLNNLGTIYEITGEYDRAEKAYDEELDTHRATGDVRMTAITMNNQGKLFVRWVKRMPLPKNTKQHCASTVISKIRLPKPPP